MKIKKVSMFYNVILDRGIFHFENCYRDMHTCAPRAHIFYNCWDLEN